VFLVKQYYISVNKSGTPEATSYNTINNILHASKETVIHERCDITLFHNRMQNN